MQSNVAKIIVNPYAGRWKARSAVPAIRQACDRIGLEHDLVLTQKPGEGIDLAAEAVRAGYCPIVAAGGDGTINEVLNGLIHASGDQIAGPLGVIPLGSADDLADELGLPKEVEAACRVIQQGHLRMLDVGCVNGRYFDNNSAVGLEPSVTVIQEGMRRLRGTPRYLAAALLGILRFKPWRVRLLIDDETHDGTMTLVSVGNTRRTGGAFYMTPHAAPDDGALDVVYAAALSRLRLLRLLPMTFTGAHVGQPAIRSHRVTHLCIDCDPPTPIQADGELFDRAATHIEYTILPGKLQVIVPAPPPQS